MARIAFFQNVSYPYIGVMYLASMLSARGHKVEVFIKENLTDNELAEIAINSFSPDIAAFSVMSASYKWALGTAKILKEKSRGGICTVMGGPHPTFFPDIINESAIDAICVGEGENAFAQYVDSLGQVSASREILNFWVKIDGKIFKNDVRNLQTDIDGLPFPSRDVYFEKYPHLLTSRLAYITSRGCPYACSYCFNQSLVKIYSGKGRYVRQRSPENVIREIELDVNRYRTKNVYFQDDIFTLNRAFLKDFLPLYKSRIGLPFICLSRIELLDDEKLSLLKDAGCVRIFWGLESGNETIRREMLNRDIPDKMIIEKALLLKKYNIPFRTYNMIGAPGETLHNAYETVALNIKIGTDYPWCSMLTPYPKTGVAEIFKRVHKVSPAADDFSSTFFKSSLLNTREYRMMANLQKLFVYSVKFPVLFPAIKLIIRLPFTFLFDIFFLLSYAWSSAGSELFTTGDILRMARSNTRNFFLGKNK